MTTKLTAEELDAFSELEKRILDGKGDERDYSRYEATAHHLAPRLVAQVKADAELIAELAEALRNIQADAETAQERRTGADYDFATCHAIEYALAALAKVEGK